MKEINLCNRIKELPNELQHKIFYYSLEHPTAKIMKELIKETDELNEAHFDIFLFKYDKLSFYKYLIINRYLKTHYDFDFIIYLLTL